MTARREKRRSLTSVLIIYVLLGCWSLPLVCGDEDRDDTSRLSAFEILLRLYDGTGGANWDDNTDWLDDSDVCGWFGITCYGEDTNDKRKIGHVRKIDLSSNHLVGTMPSEVYSLPYIATLMVRDNPDLVLSMKNIKEAQHLNSFGISNTAVSSIDGVAAAENLRLLHITELHLGGPIPEDILKLTKLQGLFANFNDFTSTIPTNIGDLTDLRELYMFQNDLTGQLPSEIGSLTKLKTLALAQNAFSGSIPEQINQCTKLEILAIQRDKGNEKGKGISGNLPSLSDLEQVTEIYFENQRMTGPISSEFLRSAPRSEALKVDLSGNEIDGTVPVELSEFTRMRLYLKDNKITEVPDELCDNIPSWFGREIEELGCDAFLCPPMSYASEGRRTNTEECQDCATASFWGSTECPAPSTSEREILITFYDAMGGRSWKDNDNWLNPQLDEGVCSWFGITCTGGFVSSIDLKNNQLSGVVPKSLFTLPELRELILASNSIDFKFEGISKATKLEVLDLSHTDLKTLSHVGELAETSIQVLRLTSNPFNNELPQELLKLTSLQFLYMNHNKLTGTLPPEIGQLTNLLRLQAYGNSFVGQVPSEVGLLSQLTDLSLAENDFSGLLPPQLEKLTNLERLSIHQTRSLNGIGGNLLSFRDAKKLSLLQLNGNNLEGALPDDMLFNTEMSDEQVEIQLADNRLSGEIPSSWADRFEMLTVDITGNEISLIPNVICEKTDWMEGAVANFQCDAIACPPGTFNEFGRRTDPESICRDCDAYGATDFLGSKSCSDGATNSEIDILRALYFETGGPSSWEDTSGWETSRDYCNDWVGIQCDDNGNVKKIDLSQNGLTGTPPKSIWALEYLTELDLQDNQLSFNFEGIGQATNLNVLYLSNTGLDSIQGVDQATNLVSLHLTSNDLSGSMPSELFELTKLTELLLNHNKLSGRIPAEISKLTMLERLFLFRNKLEGQIPAAIGALSNVKFLALGENDLSGSLPAELNDLSSIEVLALQKEGGTGDFDIGTDEGTNTNRGTGIRGPLLSFNKLPKLRELYISYNSLTGTIPFDFLDGIEDKSASITVDLTSNQVTGKLPASLTQFGNLTIEVSRNKFTGIAEGICLKSDWMGGDVGRYNCSGIACPPGTSSQYGRQQDESSACETCDGSSAAPYYGSTSCLDEEDQQILMEREVLENFFVSLGGSRWEVNTNWMDSDASFCTWHGITCVSAKQESVSSIQLAKNSLSGTVNTAGLFSLPNLAELNLAGNDIDINLEGIENAKLEYLNLDETGLKTLSGIGSAAAKLKLLHITGNHFDVFPEEVFSLTNLEVLFVSDNDFMGNLPEDLQRLSNLVFFEGNNCGFKGGLPSWLAAWTNVEYLSLSTNSLSGQLPASTISSLSSLKHLDLSSQTLGGGEGLIGDLIDFSGLRFLRELYLNRNSITGKIPASFLSDLEGTALVTIDLRSNQIEGSIPSSLAEIEKLNLYLADNRIDEIPNEICAKSSWNQGNVQQFGCDGILCDKGKFNILGRATADLQCNPCPIENGTQPEQFFGSTSCGGSLERDILTSMFVDLAGPGWTNKDGWLEDEDLCTWYGISCYDGGERDGRIQSIVLSDNNMRGDLSTAIYELPFLNALDVKKNNITVSFQGIPNAQILETLYLSETSVQSLDGIGGAKALLELHLTNCGLSGPLPNQLFDLSKLQRLFLNYNSFASTLSTNIGKLTGLQDLYLLHNQLTGSLPSEVGLLSDLKLLALGENAFTGVLPPQLNSLSSLEILSLHSESGVSGTEKGFSGPLLSFDGLPNLRELYLGSNSLNGTIPTGFLSGVSETSASVTVDLTFNEIEGTIPSRLSEFDDLQLLLSGNKVAGISEELCQKEEWMEGLVGLVGCDAILCKPGSFSEYGRQIKQDTPCEACAFNGSAQFYGSTTCDPGDTENIDARSVLFQLYRETGGDEWVNRNNWLEDQISICRWHGIQCETVAGEDMVNEIQLPSNNLVGTVPAHVFLLPSLRILNLRGNKVDLSFQAVGSAAALEELNLEATDLSSLDGISKASSLRTMNLKQTSFGGKLLSDEIFDLTSLQKLKLSESGFAGPLTSRIGGLANLKELDCRGNDFSGEIPDAIGNLEKLEVLDLSECFFFGPLPPGLNKLTSLRALFLDSFSRNTAGLSGPILSFSSMPKLRDISLGSNSLTGTIPEDLLAGVDPLDETITIGLKSCHITGTIPDSLSKFERLNIDLTGNKVTGISEELCKKNLWMEGAVGDYGCEAILCPAGTFNRFGRQPTASSPCIPCSGDDSSEYLGSTSCVTIQKETERKILELLFQTTGGSNWKRQDGWMEQETDICRWFGISCNEAGTVDSIVLGANNLKGSIPKDLFELSNMQYLWLYSNPLQFSFDGIEKATRLRSLLLDSTGLTSLAGIGGASALVDLDVRFNSIAGNLPSSELQNLRSLESFSCSNNPLEGPIPTFNNNRRLINLRLGNCDFTGTLPSFSTHTNLKTIDLSDNQITGTIPPDLLKSADPNSSLLLDLSTNRLAGTVPSDLALLTDLTIYLRDNMLEGIDQEVCEQASWNEGDVGAFGCDGILCPAKTYAPGLGRATQDGSLCVPCDKAQYWGSSTCGGHSAGTAHAFRRSGAFIFVVSLILYLGVY